MSIFESIAGNLPIVGGAAALAVGGFALWQMRRNESSANKGDKKSVEILNPVDYSAFTLPITEETEKGLVGPKVKDVYWRLYKGGPGWNYPQGRRKWIAFPGDAYTGVVIDDAEKKVRLPEAMRLLWGKDAYDKMPTPLKDVLEKHQFAVTIEPQPVPKKDKDLVVTMEDSTRETIIIAMKALRDNMNKKSKIDWIQALSFIAIGVLVGVMLVNWHVIKLG